MSVTNFRRASLKTGFPKSSDFADIPYTPPPAGDIIQTNLVRNYNAQNPASYPGTGTTWTDLMGSGYNATLTNGPTYTAGTPNYFSTDGVNDFRPDWSPETAFGEQAVVVGFNSDVDPVIDQALAMTKTPGGKKLVSTPKSEEPESVTTKSPINSFKGYPR